MLGKLLSGILVVCSLASPAIAAGPKVPPGKWWQMGPLAEELNLTEEHKNRLDELYLNNRRNLIGLKGEVEKERLELDYLLDKEALDETAVVRQFEQLERARTNLATERFNYFLQVRKTIGHDRFQQLKMRFHELRRQRIRRGREKIGDEGPWRRPPKGGDNRGRAG